MGNSYVRQSAADIQTGNIVEADPINAEFNALQSAFDASAGHSHDGTVGEGQKISLTSSITGVLPVANGGYGGTHNNSATTNPGVTNDSSQGYAIGSVWVNTTLDTYYVCTDNTLGAAVWISFQPIDAALTSISGLTTSANQTIYTTGSDTYATTSLTTYGRSLIDDADASTARTTLGLGTIATQNSNSVTITGGTISGTPISGSTVAGTTGTFSGNVSGVAGTFSGAVSGTTGTFSGAITSGGSTVWHSGNLTPANYALLAGATFTGGISGTTASFSGSVTASGQAVWHAGNLTPANYAPLAGATFTGSVVLNADPTVALGAATKQYVDAKPGRNRIINGDMRVAQRGTSFSSFGYTVDRWVSAGAGTVATVTQVTGPSGFRNALRFTGAVGNTLTQAQQRIEAFNTADMVGAPCSIQAVISASTPQTFRWELFYANAADNFNGGVTLITSGTWSVTATAQKFTAVTGNLPASAANGLLLAISANNAGAFTSGTFDLTGAQLEAGAVPTAFEFVDFSTQLERSRRYYETGQSDCTGISFSGNGDTRGPLITYSVGKRIAPTLSFSNYSLSIFAVGSAGHAVNLTADIAATRSYPSGFSVSTLGNYANVSAAVGGGTFVWSLASGPVYYADAEL